MPLQVVVHNEVVYEGEIAAVPRVGELVERAGESLPVESVTWDFRDAGLVVATVVVGARPYTY